MAKIDTWLAELEKYRDAVNGDSLHNWFGYFDFGKVLFVTANAMLASGLLYKKLDKDDIAALQQLAHELSPSREQQINNELVRNRQILMDCRTQNRMNGWVRTYKPEAVSHAKFLEKMLCDHRRNLQEIIGRIQ